MKKIKLTESKYGEFETLVDDDIFEIFKGQKLYLDPRYKEKNFYVYIPERKGIRMKLHTFVTKAKKGEMVDHINGDGLDNRRCNLRIVTRRQNSLNSKPKSNTSSKFKGVSRRKNSKKWVASINIYRKSHYLGAFEDEEKAALAYNEAAKMHYGEYAYLNKV